MPAKVNKSAHIYIFLDKTILIFVLQIKILILRLITFMFEGFKLLI